MQACARLTGGRPWRSSRVRETRVAMVQLVERRTASKEHPGEIDAMFVQSAEGFSSTGETLSLHGMSHPTLFFADRPEREVGHIDTRRFVSMWGDGERSFDAVSPSAVLSFSEPGSERPAEVVAALSEPLMGGDTVSYRVDVLDGSLPPRGGPCVLVIQVSGRLAEGDGLE
jgi:hypothetical protein